ncbi:MULTISPECIES: flagellar biosynthetic protein FliR [Aneurinibacillus]|uniref:Flagellar biosynthetic protein FliR n=1 Tax=Aneurinibacillus thermoaerophilus TaxID=143495 RepID=A0A1G7WF02_ANETH|nr:MULTISPECIES: flagellar biosynthetic protein FliR [Aneurinibacillus]AMA72683.1 flagellar biosynthetic protein FliR [Aneurinibacillus sp. XH2]MED0674599.1 flagellar biosynthetic protein FliR [Aneurinibacillus thermoaerophilus]MED0677968.1 flagellar biosynthetic protein FliR [Aneurinibacillus thermoaerophilus]MED0736969.1 flagellar biosynthetic protein FliR [Aneurinibacillus thermoaerophilus]MED0756810.1 flagellar biosynthetic protein FliR [Aneurinibacillus thermoaerophilus]
MQLLELLPAFLLVFVRLTAFFVTAPIFSTRSIPAVFKIGLSFFIAFIAFPLVKANHVIPVDWTYVYLVIKEVLTGLLLGFLAALFLAAVQVAGSIIDMMLGLAMASVVDPLTGTQAPLMGNFKYILTMLFILSANGHHLLIQGVLSSYQVVPLDRWFSGMSDGTLSTFLIEKFSYMFMSGMLLAAPLVSSLFVIDLALGIMAKTVPQMNIFVVGMPVKILAGFLILVVVFPGYFFVMTRLLEVLFSAMARMIEIMGAVP